MKTESDYDGIIYVGLILWDLLTIGHLRTDAPDNKGEWDTPEPEGQE